MATERLNAAEQEKTLHTLVDLIDECTMIALKCKRKRYDTALGLSSSIYLTNGLTVVKG